jgi:hypothetical protein
VRRILEVSDLRGLRLDLACASRKISTRSIDTGTARASGLHTSAGKGTVNFAHDEIYEIVRFVVWWWIGWVEGRMENGIRGCRR